ncbi:MAG: OmpH family outer membrane protein [Alphaproteobacteria bacterium]|nr:OmpH family outer membrane protein [Alphaproteobacteria bacterium]MBP9877475.1 OmpH family outer membrane protein [Alphaproteobacteria bacterium]
MSIAVTENKLLNESQSLSQDNVLRKTKLLVAACSFAAVIPFMMSQTALAENIFQKKGPQSEAPKEEGQSSTPAPQEALLNTELTSIEAAQESPAANPSEQENNTGSILGNRSPAAVSQMTSSKGMPKIIVVDVQGVLMSSSVGKDIKKQFDDKQAAFMKEIEVEEGELKKTEQDLLRQRTVLSQDVFAKKKAEFDERMVALNTKFQKNRQILEEAFNLARTDVESKLLDVIKEVKIEQSANLVLPAQQVIMGDDQMDVTNEVLSRFNKKVPSYKVNF